MCLLKSCFEKVPDMFCHSSHNYVPGFETGHNAIYSHQMPTHMMMCMQLTDANADEYSVQVVNTVSNNLHWRNTGSKVGRGAGANIQKAALKRCCSLRCKYEVDQTAVSNAVRCSSNTDGRTVCVHSKRSLSSLVG